MNITLNNGNSVKVYRSKMRDTYINSNDCTTEYKAIKKGAKIYEVVK